MDSKWRLAIPLALLLAVLATAGLPLKAYAHGAEIEYTFNTSIEIAAKYDSGEPMDGAQVSVYAPQDPATPWLSGVCDEEGRFSFAPDPSQPGTWDVQVRLAGHGDIIHIEVGEGATGTGGSGYSVLQLTVMAVCVIWGLAATALYLQKRKA